MTNPPLPSELVRRLAGAWLERDRATIETILADEWMVIDPAGRVLTKAQVLAEFDAGTRTLDTATVDEITERHFGDVSVITGRTSASGTYQGQSVSVRLRFTDVFVKRDQGWKAVSSQATRIAE